MSQPTSDTTTTPQSPSQATLTPEQVRTMVENNNATRDAQGGVAARLRSHVA